MIRLLLVAVMVVPGSVAYAHEGMKCKCRQADESLSFREEVLSNLCPLTREVIEPMLLTDEWGNGLQNSYRVMPGKGLRVTFPPMTPQPIKSDFKMPRLETPSPSENQPLPNHLAVS